MGPVPVPLRGAGPEAAAAAKAARIGSCGAPSAVCLDGLLGAVVGCACVFVVDRTSMPLVECLLSVLYSSMNAATSHLAWARVRKCRRSNNSRVALNDSLTALSRADPVRPMEWVTPALRHAVRNRLPVCTHRPGRCGRSPRPRRRHAPRWPCTAPRGPARRHGWMPMANPTQRRECRSSTAASCSLPSPVGISVDPHTDARPDQLPPANRSRAYPLIPNP
jgi:hypothetical protein